MSIWFENVERTVKPSEKLGSVLLAAYLYDNSRKF